MGETGWRLRHGIPSGDARQRRDLEQGPSVQRHLSGLKLLYRGELYIATCRGGLPKRTVNHCFLLSDELGCALAGEQGMLLMSLECQCMRNMV